LTSLALLTLAQLTATVSGPAAPVVALPAVNNEESKSTFGVSEGNDWSTSSVTGDNACRKQKTKNKTKNHSDEIKNHNLHSRFKDNLLQGPTLTVKMCHYSK
jgi:hypothetical protein